MKLDTTPAVQAALGALPTALQAGLAKVAKDATPAMQKALADLPKAATDGLAKSVQGIRPSIDQALKPVGDTIKTDVSKIPAQVSPAISSAFAAIGAQISAAIRSIASAAGSAAAAGAAPEGGRVLPNPIPGAINYRAPSVSPPPRAQTASFTVHTHTHLDGEKVAQNTTHHQARWGAFPTSVGGFDTYANYGGPSLPLADSA